MRLIAKSSERALAKPQGRDAQEKVLRVGLYCDREDWVLGTIAKQIQRVYGSSGRFDFAISSWHRFIESPLSQIHTFKRCDVIHWLSPYGYFELGALFPQGKHICTIHHCLPGDRLWPTAFQGTRVLTISQLSRRELETRGFKGVMVVNDGVDGRLFRPLSRNLCRETLNICTRRPLIGFFGKEDSNPQDRKGTRTFVRVVRILAAARPIAVLIGGEGWDGLVADLELTGAEVFRRRVDTVKEMPVLYGAIDVYLCASRIEGGPVTVLESMACERPVVATPVGHAPELIRNGENGLLVPVDDAQATACAVEQILADQDLANRIARAGRTTVLKQWTWEKVLQPLGEIYEQVLEEPKRGRLRLLRMMECGSKLLARWARYWVEHQ